MTDLPLSAVSAPIDKIEEKYEKGPWTGGIPVGYLQETDERVKVNFKKEHGGCGKTFHKKVHGSFTRAIAESFQKRECEKRGLTKNQVRLVTVDKSSCFADWVRILRNEAFAEQWTR